MPRAAVTDPIIEGLIARLGREEDARFDRAIGNPLQEAINAINCAEAARECITRAAARAHARFPQYEGHWGDDKWQVGVIRSRVRTKLGVAFERGDLILWHEPTAEDIRFAEKDGLPAHRTAYSIRNGIDTAFDTDVRPMAER